jgi:hypothetical protein
LDDKLEINDYRSSASADPAEWSHTRTTGRPTVFSIRLASNPEFVQSCAIGSLVRLFFRSIVIAEHSVETRTRIGRNRRSMTRAWITKWRRQAQGDGRLSAVGQALNVRTVFSRPSEVALSLIGFAPSVGVLESDEVHLTVTKMSRQLQYESLLRHTPCVTEHNDYGRIDVVGRFHLGHRFINLQMLSDGFG